MDGDKPDISKHFPFSKWHNSANEIHFSGTNFMATPGEFAYICGEGTYKIYSNGPFLEGIFRPKGSSPKYFHRICLMETDLEIDLIFSKIFGKTLL
jgi:hypothetical protein